MIRFTSKAGAAVTMFDEPALTLIRMMGHSGTVPSALLAEDIAPALVRLKQALAERGEEAGAAEAAPVAQDPGDDDDEAEQAVSLSTRAYPLLQLLESADRRQAAIMWDYYVGTFV
jgi:hypothetical protein